MLGRIRRPSPATIIACIALAIALGGVSYAATVLPRNSVGLLQLRANSVNSSKVINGSLLRADFRAGQIPAGPAGPAGAATALWAVVDSAGALARNKGVASAQRLGLGDYLVTFNQDITGCSYVASVGGPTTSNVPGEVSPAQRTGVAAAVEVETYTSAGASADRSFYLAVFC